MEEIRK